VAAEAARELVVLLDPQRVVRLDRPAPQVIFLINLVIQVDLVVQVQFQMHLLLELLVVVAEAVVQIQLEAVA
jgi:hypothetical protein